MSIKIYLKNTLVYLKINIIANIIWTNVAINDFWLKIKLFDDKSKIIIVSKQIACNLQVLSFLQLHLLVFPVSCIRVRTESKLHKKKKTKSKATLKQPLRFYLINFQIQFS